jgi:RHS repeat-associated protein
MSYMIEDHQGGVANIASKTGAADVNESFSAFGQRRNPATWSGAPTTGDLNTIAGLSRQGYTFQTWLGQSMGLNHMNGRVEDAILGRFLSPDPHIPDPTNPQSYNRYSYVMNNPVSYIDPSGFCGQSTHREISAAASFGCGGGVTIPMGSVEGLSGTPDDGFGNLDNVGTPEPPSASSLAATANAALGNTINQLSAANANSITAQTQSELSDLGSSTAQSRRCSFLALFDETHALEIPTLTFCATSAVPAGQAKKSLSVFVPPSNVGLLGYTPFVTAHQKRKRPR